jgi:putative hydrolase of the HAD superfamily
LAENSNYLDYSLVISNQCYTFASSVLENAKPVLEKLTSKYPLVLVSNFYGNIETVLKDYGLISYFIRIIESAVVNIRKPDPAIFDLGVKAMGFSPEEVVVVGDSYKKDIVPAGILGCQTIWLKGQAWEEEAQGSTADAVISDFNELEKIFN